MSTQTYEEEESSSGGVERRKEFDCPECNANNPCDEFGPGDEVRCFYCGMEFKVQLSGEGRWKFREI